MARHRTSEELYFDVWKWQWEASGLWLLIKVITLPLWIWFWVLYRQLRGFLVLATQGRLGLAVAQLVLPWIIIFGFLYSTQSGKQTREGLDAYGRNTTSFLGETGKFLSAISGGNGNANKQDEP